MRRHISTPVRFSTCTRHDFAGLKLDLKCPWHDRRCPSDRCDRGHVALDLTRSVQVHTVAPPRREQRTQRGASDAQRPVPGETARTKSLRSVCDLRIALLALQGCPENGRKRSLSVRSRTLRTQQRATIDAKVSKTPECLGEFARRLTGIPLTHSRTTIHGCRQEKLFRTFTESLILAQDERWRRA